MSDESAAVSVSPEEPRPAIVDALAAALCANDECEDRDYGNDFQASFLADAVLSLPVVSRAMSYEIEVAAAKRDSPRTLRDAVLLELWPELDGYSKAEANLITDAVTAVLSSPLVSRALQIAVAVDDADDRVVADDLITIVTLPSGARTVSAVGLLSHLRGIGRAVGVVDPTVQS